MQIPKPHSKIQGAAQESAFLVSPPCDSDTGILRSHAEKHRDGASLVAFHEASGKDPWVL